MDNSVLMKSRKGIYSSSIVGAIFNVITTLIGLFTLITPVMKLGGEVKKILESLKLSDLNQFSLFPTDMSQMVENDLAYTGLIIMVVLACICAVLLIINLVKFFVETSSKKPSKHSYSIIGAVNVAVVLAIAIMSLVTQYEVLSKELESIGSFSSQIRNSLFFENGTLPLAFAVFVLYTIQLIATYMLNNNVITNHNFLAKVSTEQDFYSPTIVGKPSNIMLSRVVDNSIAMVMLLIAGCTIFFAINYNGINIFSLVLSPLMIAATYLPEDDLMSTMESPELFACAITALGIAILGLVLFYIASAMLSRNYAKKHELANSKITTIYSSIALFVTIAFSVFAAVAIALIGFTGDEESEFIIKVNFNVLAAPIVISVALSIIKPILTKLFRINVIKDIDLKKALSKNTNSVEVTDNVASVEVVNVEINK